MPQSTFSFKKFTIAQDNCAMKVGTDAVLIGAWIRPSTSQRILDIGTGTGIIALMLAQKTNGQIDAIEIDTSAVLQANENVASSPWKHQIRILNISFQDFHLNTNLRFDLIVTNPPYFLNSTKTPSVSRNFARHTDSLSFNELLDGVYKLLTDLGRFYIILPASESKLFCELSQKIGLFLTEVLFVKPRIDKPVFRHLMCFKKNPEILNEKTIVIEEARHVYTSDYKQLTKDYYLNF